MRDTIAPAPLEPRAYTDTTAAITVRDLRMDYGGREVLRGVDLEVRRGEIFAFLGPNGAGKTTTVEILEGFRRRTGGEVRVLGEDPAVAGTSWRERVGVVLQESQIEPMLTARECLELYAGYYAAPRAVDETLALVGLAEKADERAGHLSGGQQRRLDVALALIGDPDVVFLDEPTTGFDPAARRTAWEAIGGLRALGKTVFLTTHFMEEAEALADRIAVLARGVIVAEGTAQTLGGRNERASRVSFVLPWGLHDGPALDVLAGADVGADGRVTLETTAPLEVVAALADWADHLDTDVHDLEVRRPTLEDMYLELTEMS